MLFYLIAIVVFAVDQTTKILIRKYVEIGETFTFWGMPMTHYENSGMAHSLFQGNGRLFAVAAVLFIAGIVYYRRAGELKGPIIDSSFGFLVGGAAGNGIDRILFGQVTDFLLSRSGNGVLNMADHAIEAGVLLLLLYGIVYVARQLRAKVRPRK